MDIQEFTVYLLDTIKTPISLDATSDSISHLEFKKVMSSRLALMCHL
jgi:hypothetical protein